jgi:uncharacterized membrane protein YebE (DUF533 family)
MSQESSFLTAVHVWAATAWADGVVTPEESAVMRGIIAVAKLTDEERQIARGWLENPVDLGDVKVDIIDADQREHIFSAALGVVAIDKEVAEAETVFIEHLREALDIDEETAAELRKHAKV